MWKWSVRYTYSIGTLASIYRGLRFASYFEDDFFAAAGLAFAGAGFLATGFEGLAAALDFSFSLEKKYSAKPETIFDTLYYRSVTFYEMNEKEKAQNILSKILEVKPEHIKSRIKLNEWKDQSWRKQFSSTFL